MASASPRGYRLMDWLQDLIRSLCSTNDHMAFQWDVVSKHCCTLERYYNTGLNRLLKPSSVHFLFQLSFNFRYVYIYLKHRFILLGNGANLKLLDKTLVTRVQKSCSSTAQHGQTLEISRVTRFFCRLF